ncbi:bacteriorhodopsin-like [Microbacterium lacus]|uniref:bacteriorhodopsin-like n=1 Tax=Microbacterium lacus TaxID=415217 RepID=UPI001E5CC1EC|nr:bacteriorhodopsin-like [Microbacterium lacus]
MIPDLLTAAQFSTVYNALSLVIAAQLFTAIFLLISLPRVLPRYRTALTIALVVCGIAAYHYFRIFDSFNAAFTTEAAGGLGDYTTTAGAAFNEGYRYVDWLLTVPLLLVELIAVLALARQLQNRLLMQLVPASILMIVLGYPGEISSDLGVRTVFGILSTIPFLFILYVLFVQLSRSLANQPEAVRGKISRLRYLLVLSWGVYRSPTCCRRSTSAPMAGCGSRSAIRSRTSWRRPSTPSSFTRLRARSRCSKTRRSPPWSVRTPTTVRRRTRLWRPDTGPDTDGVPRMRLRYPRRRQRSSDAKRSMSLLVPETMIRSWFVTTVCASA